MPGKRTRVAEGLAAALRFALMRTFACAAQETLALKCLLYLTSDSLDSHVHCESTPLYESAITPTTPSAREWAASRFVNDCRWRKEEKWRTGPANVSSHALPGLISEQMTCCSRSHPRARLRTRRGDWTATRSLCQRGPYQASRGPSCLV